MKSKSFVIGALLLVLLLVGFAVFKSKNNSSKAPSDSMMGSEESMMGEASLKDLLMAGNSQKCTYSSSNEKGSGEGTVYVTNGMMRGDFSVVLEAGQVYRSHMIAKDNTSYVWSDDQTTGFMMEFDSADKFDIPNDPSVPGSIESDISFSYDCNAWVPNDSQFELPSGVEFTSMGEMMEEVKDKMSDKCGLCDSLEGDSKTQCLTALECS